MKIITKKSDTPRVVYDEVEYQVLQTSDGREFDIKDKDNAAYWQAKLDKGEVFKRSINYQEVDLQECWCSSNWDWKFDKSFVFDWDGGDLISGGLTELQQVYTGYEHQLPVSKRGEFYEKHYKGMRLPTGQYICIQYINDSGDCSPLFDGFFGTLNDYCDYLSSEIERIGGVKNKALQLIKERVL